MTLRLVLAAFGVIVCSIGAALAVTVVNAPALAAVLAFLAAVAVADIIVVSAGIWAASPADLAKPHPLFPRWSIPRPARASACRAKPARRQEWMIYVRPIRGQRNRQARRIGTSAPAGTTTAIPASRTVIGHGGSLTYRSRLIRTSSPNRSSIATTLQIEMICAPLRACSALGPSTLQGWQESVT